jgi:hypothetical protein
VAGFASLLGCGWLAAGAVSGAGASLDISARTIPNGDPEEACPDDGAAWEPTEVAAPALSGRTGVGNTA